MERVAVDNCRREILTASLRWSPVRRPTSPARNTACMLLNLLVASVGLYWNG